MSATSNSLLSGIRKIATGTTRFKSIAEAIAAVKAKITDVEKLDFKVLNAVTQTSVGAYDPEIVQTALYTRYAQSFVPLEPDRNLLRVWLRLGSIGHYAEDSSLNDRPKTVNRGKIAHFNATQPLVVSGPPAGYQDFATAVYLNCQERGETVDFYPGLSDVTFAGNPNGFSICMKLKPDNFDVDPLGLGPQCIFSKRDDDANGYFAALEPNGDIVFQVKKSGTVYSAVWDNAQANILGSPAGWGELAFIVSPIPIAGPPTPPPPGPSPPPPGPPTPPPPPPGGIVKLTPTTVTASANDGNVPANAVDGNLATRWSSTILGTGAWIELAFGAAYVLDRIELDYYNNPTRTYTIDLSGDSGAAFLVNQTHSSTTTHVISLNNIILNKIRATLRNTTGSTYFSVLEIRVFGTPYVPPPPTPPPPTPPPPPPTPPPPPPSSVVKLTATATASGNDGNVPANTLDGNLATRWSNAGVGSWIEFDLAAVYVLDRIELDYYNTPTRTYTIDLSGDTGISNTFPKNAQHNSTSTHIIALNNVQSQHVRATLVSSTGSTFFSVTEARIYGSVIPPPPPSPPPGPPSPVPPPPPTPPPPTPPPPPPAPGNDVFGIKKIYADAPAPYNNWSISSTTDPRFFEEQPVSIGGGWYRYQDNTQGRIEVLPVAGLKETDIDTYYYPTVIQKGYLHLPANDPSGNGDWGDIEMTLAMRNVSQGSGSFEAHHEFVRGGFRQSTNSSGAGKDKRVVISCEAMSYHANIYHQSNRAKFEKDTKHTDGYTVESSNPSFPGVMAQVNRTTGFIHKAVFYRVPNSNVLGGYAMKLEQYLSTDGLTGQAFTKIGEFLDHGQWGPTRGTVASSCGCPNEFPVHSQSVCCPGIRIDFMNSFEFSKFSIRSINSGVAAPSPPAPPPPPPSPTNCTDGWSITGYYNVLESDYPAGGATTVVNIIGFGNYTALTAFMTDAQVEGVGMTKTGIWITNGGSGTTWTRVTFPPDGMDPPGQLRVGYSIAVDPLQIPLGTSNITIPTLPAPWNTYSYTAVDTATGITGKKIDVFCGDGVAAKNEALRIASIMQRVCINTGSGTVAKIAVAAVTASSDDGNLPANAIDGNMATRWSTGYGIGTWIELDMGTKCILDHIEIDYYNNTPRTYTIDLSGDAGVTFPKSQTHSSATTHTIPLNNVQSRLIRLTLVSLTGSTFFSILEIRVFGIKGSAFKATLSDPLVTPNLAIVLNGAVKNTRSTHETADNAIFPVSPDNQLHIARSSSLNNNRANISVADFRWYAKPLSTADITNLRTNKVSISNIAKGSVAVAGHSWLGTSSAGFTLEGFTDLGFTKTEGL